MWYQVTPVQYWTKNSNKPRIGLYIHRRKTNTFVILDKDMKEVKHIRTFITWEASRGCAYFNLNPKGLLYQK